MNALNKLIILSIAVTVSAPLMASPNYPNYTWADVIDAQPVTRTYRQPVEKEVCWQEEVHRAVPERRSKATPILGAIIGGVIGNQFGGGRGQDIMTVAGAALGHATVKDSQNRNHPNRYYTSLADRCEINTEWQESRKIIAWDVTYEYDGIAYQTRMQDRPGDQIKVRVNVEPVTN